jgi:hypothetical protein
MEPNTRKLLLKPCHETHKPSRRKNGSKQNKIRRDLHIYLAWVCRDKNLEGVANAKKQNA